MVLCAASAGCAITGKDAGLRSECSRIAHLSGSGEHKPAVDAAGKLEASGMTCPPSVRDEVSASRETLLKADSYVHKAVRRRKEGNLLSARANLERALEIYPRYYWVQTLKRNVERSIQTELENLTHEASYFESRGEPDNALARIRDALKLSPADGKLVSEAARLERLIADAQTERDARGILARAGDLLEEGRYDEAQRLLTAEGAPEMLGAGGQEMLAEVDRRRRAEIDGRFAEAVEMEKSGDLEAAASTMLHVLGLSQASDGSAGDIVNFARILGMKFYSAGELSRAKELWTGALDLDPGNQKLQGYLQEVQARLDSLDRIKKGETESDGNGP